MNDRETILRIIGALGGDPAFWGDSKLCRVSLEKAEAVLREYRSEEVSRLQGIVNGFADRIAAAHEVIAKRAEKDDRHELVALIGVLWQHAEPSIRHDDIREQIACVLSTAGNVPRSEKPM